MITSQLSDVSCIDKLSAKSDHTPGLIVHIYLRYGAQSHYPNPTDLLASIGPATSDLSGVPDATISLMGCCSSDSYKLHQDARTVTSLYVSSYHALVAHVGFR